MARTSLRYRLPTEEELDDVGLIKAKGRMRAPIDPEVRALAERIVDKIDFGKHDRRTVVLLAIRLIHEVRDKQKVRQSEEVDELKKQLETTLRETRTLRAEIALHRAQPIYNPAELEYIHAYRGLGLTYEQLADLLGGDALQVEAAHNAFKFEMSPKGKGAVRFAHDRQPKPPGQRRLLDLNQDS